MLGWDGIGYNELEGDELEWPLCANVRGNTEHRDQSCVHREEERGWCTSST